MLGLFGPERLRLCNRILVKLATRHNAPLLNLHLTSRVLDNEQIQILTDRHLPQTNSVRGDIQDALLLTDRELTRQVNFEPLDQLWRTVVTMARVADWIFHYHFLKV